jgi:hypothetical protein
MRVMPWNLWWRFGDEWRDRERRRALPPAHRQRGGAPAPSRDRDEIVALAVVVDHPDGPLHAVASCIDWKLEFAPQRLAPDARARRAAHRPCAGRPASRLPDRGSQRPAERGGDPGAERGQVDAWVAGGGDADAGHTLSAGNPSPRARRGRSISASTTVAGDPEDGLHPSDHYAVVADFLL